MDVPSEERKADDKRGNLSKDSQKGNRRRRGSLRYED